MARKFTKGKQRAIVKALRAGEYAKAAAEAQGVDESTYYRWLQRGEAALKAADDDDEPVDAKELGYADFLGQAGGGGGRAGRAAAGAK